jgi:hypothetical protein
LRPGQRTNRNIAQDETVKAKVPSHGSGDKTMIIDATDLDPSSAYKLLIGSIIPRAIGRASTLSVRLREWIEAVRRA